MWLINIETMDLEAHYDPLDTPGYAILSHTWGPDEVSFQEWMMVSRRKKLRQRGITTDAGLDMDVDQICQKSGYLKILKFCEQARRDKLGLAWVDTCCIDKSSSAELSEAINSMFLFYAESTMCYVFLEDVPSGEPEAFPRSRWFTRGWTLQELLAPRDANFYDGTWNKLGSKRTMQETLRKITGIDTYYLSISVDAGNPVNQASLAERMSWAASRQTTRGEDMAYCLLGIFDIHMPLLYGEGEANAFVRLQQEIIKKTEDQSIFAWGYLEGSPHVPTSIFAPSPDWFVRCDVVKPNHTKQPPFQMTNKGLQITLDLVQAEDDLFYGLLDCATQDGILGIPLGPLRPRSNFLEDGVECTRVANAGPVCFSKAVHRHIQGRMLFIVPGRPGRSWMDSYKIEYGGMSGYILEEVYPPHCMTGRRLYPFTQEDEEELNRALYSTGKKKMPLKHHLVFQKYRYLADRNKDFVLVVEFPRGGTWRSREDRFIRFALDFSALRVHTISRSSPEFPRTSLAELLIEKPQLRTDKSWWYPQPQQVLVKVGDAQVPNYVLPDGSNYYEKTIYLRAKETHDGGSSSPAEDHPSNNVSQGIEWAMSRLNSGVIRDEDKPLD